MPDLAEILRMPSYRCWDNAWERLTEGDTLFQALRESVRRGSVGEASKWVEDWKNSFVDSSKEEEKEQQKSQWHIIRKLVWCAFQALREAVRSGSIGRASKWVKDWKNSFIDNSKEEEKEQRKSQWRTIRKLVWCAEQAANQPDFYRSEIEGVCFALKEVPEFIQEDKVWAWICIRTFLGITGRRIEIPVAAWDEQGAGEGFPATLCLEVIKPGIGQIAHHPIDIFGTHVDKSFSKAMENAWESARNLLREEGKDVLYDGRWRLFRGGQPLPIAKGGSASGAAAMGWYHALKGTLPDEGIIVLAKVDNKGGLDSVEGIAGKVDAIFRDGRFDKIVVATEENKFQANKCIKKLLKPEHIQSQARASLEKWKSEHIQVELCDPQTIDKLIKIRSQLVKDLFYYFEKMEDELTRNPLLEDFDRKLDDLRVPLWVVDYDPVWNIGKISAREHFRKEPHPGEEEDEKDSYRRIYAYSETEDNKSKKSPRRPEPLDELEPKLKMGILLGDPGSGKTEWLKHRTCLAAREAEKRLEEFEIGVQDLCFPAYMRLRDISEDLQKESELQRFLDKTGCIESLPFSMNDADRALAAMLKCLIKHHNMPKRLVSCQL